MALHIVVTYPQQSGRIDVNLANKIGEIVSDGRPTLVCINQMTRNLDWWRTAEQINTQREVLRADILARAKQQWGGCGLVTVFFTDFAPEGQVTMDLERALDEMHKRDIKTVEDVSCSFTMYQLAVLHKLVFAVVYTNKMRTAVLQFCMPGLGLAGIILMNS